MQLFLHTLFVAALISIIVEDFKYRKISLLWLLVLLFIAFSLQIESRLPLSEIFRNVAFNIIILAFNFIGLTAYFSLKNKRLINICNYYLGIGDILFLITLSFLYSPFNFTGFMALSLVFSLVAWIFFRKKMKTIPLAGLQAAFILLQLLFCILLFDRWEFNNDSLPLTLLTNFLENG